MTESLTSEQIWSMTKLPIFHPCPDDCGIKGHVPAKRTLVRQFPDGLQEVIEMGWVCKNCGVEVRPVVD